MLIEKRCYRINVKFRTNGRKHSQKGYIYAECTIEAHRGTILSLPDRSMITYISVKELRG